MDTLQAIVAASKPAGKCVRCARHTGVPVEFFDSEEQAVLAYKRFAKQRAHAKERGIGWALSFAEWWGVWRESGKWNERGCNGNESAVMARDGDSGPYKVGNVRITTLADNFAESRQVRAALPKKQPKKPCRPPVMPGTGRGWTLLKVKTRKPYMVKVAERYIGMFASETEADAAYKVASAEYIKAHWPSCVEPGA